MIKKKHFKWSLLLPLLLLALAAVGMVIYIILPTVINSLVTAPADGNFCDGHAVSRSIARSGFEDVSSVMSDLCFTSQSFLGLSIMIVVVLSGALTWLSALLVMIDVFESNKFDNLTKALWILGALSIGYFVAALYYFIEVRKRPE